MKESYNSLDEFKRDLNNEYTFQDIAIITSCLDEKEIVGHKCRCKFHEEKTPSMQIGDHFFKCYGCDAKGDIFTFIERIKNCSFWEAINEVADAVNCKLNIKNGYSYDEIKQKRIRLQREWDYYKVEYAKACKTRPDVLKEGNRYFPFDVGYDPKKNRVVLAYIKNDQPLGFTTRRIDNNDGSPKWEHSISKTTLTSLVYQVFNIDSLKKYDTAYIVEGPGDVASMVRSGFENTICCCGTSNMSDQVIDRIQAEKINKFIICTDGDDPGKEARFKWCKEIIKYDYYLASTSYVMCIPDGKDPGECSKEELQLASKNAIPMIKYFLLNISDEDIFDIFKDKEYYNNPIKKALVVKFGDSHNLAYNDAARIILNHIKNKLKDSNGRSIDISLNKMSDREVLNNLDRSSSGENEYVCRLKATAGIGEYVVKYEAIAGLTRENAIKILKLKYKEAIE